ncbi:SDR family oxidoreductase [Lacticigenium naphthae]|uniref:SDR family oxidoreductase n=1 Tax=Lacticigenium naphthae TaxID=515351 RepID=UPI0004216DF4|nr:SDR family oxidoreductase [Lacticigenium naphthae]
MTAPFTHDFTDKVVVLTGAGGVLVSKFAKEYARAGAKVALLDLNEEAAKQFATEINEAGGIARAYKCNVLEKESIQAARDAVAKDLGTADILVNGAGGNNPRATTDNEFHEAEGLEDMKTFFDLDQDGISFVFNLNFLGTLLPTQVFAKDMIGKEGTSILNISSMNGFTPLTKIPAYSGAKAAISNFTEWLAVHFSHVGIRVNAIAPGFLVSNQNRGLLFNEDGTPTARANKILSNTPMGRFGDAEELIGGLLFLTDEKAASFVNGVVLPIDGGFNAYSGV